MPEFVSPIFIQDPYKPFTRNSSDGLLFASKRCIAILDRLLKYRFNISAIVSHDKECRAKDMAYYLETMLYAILELDNDLNGMAIWNANLNRTLRYKKVQTVTLPTLV